MEEHKNPFEEHLYNRYLQYRNEKILKPGKFKLVVAIFILIFYILLDFQVGNNTFNIYFRIPAMSIIALFFILDRTTFRKQKYNNVLLIYNSFFVALLVMIYGIYLAGYFTHGQLSHSDAEGIILVTTITGIEIRGRLSTIMAILILPFTIFSFILFFVIGNLSPELLMQFGHILVINIVMIIISYFLENQNFLAYKANNKLELERNKTQALYSNILEQNEEIQSQKEEITVQRDLAEEQKGQLEEQKKEIYDSLNYAKRIQHALLPSKELFNTTFKEHFILFKPRNIVSGDFYWATQLNNWLVFAVADCTGHGVPAGFMSMLGFSYLKEISNKVAPTNIAEILNQMRKRIIDVLDQKDEFGSAKDGMDIGLCAYNKDSNELYFAGSNFSLLLFRDSLNEPVKEEIKGDKMPISIYYNMVPFSQHHIKLKEGDAFYLFSDGYHDQFGGSLGKKIKSGVFKNLLLSIANNNMIFQRQMLSDYLEGWMNFSNEDGEKIYEQNDDITVLGIRI